MHPLTLNWQNSTDIPPRKFTCGYCGNLVGPNKGYPETSTGTHLIHICSYCARPTYVDPDTGKQYPGARFGEEVAHLPSVEIQTLYGEARDCMSVSAYTAAVLTARKVLMHVAVDQGASENQSFIKYVEYLMEKNLIPANARGWVDHIRAKANEANHEIVLMTQDEAEGLIEFTAMLLRNVYELPARVPKPKGVEIVG